MAATSFMKTWQDLDLVQLVVLPVFLFSGTFYPLSVYPEPLHTIVQFSPLYRGTDLIRRLMTAALDPVMLLDLGYLALLGMVWLRGLGLADRSTNRARDDALRLRGAHVAAIVGCAPPTNRPPLNERDIRLPYLVGELRILSEIRVSVALGAFALDGALGAHAA